MNLEKDLRKFCFRMIALIATIGLCFFNVTVVQTETSSDLITDYQTLKQVIEDPNRPTTVEVPGGTYIMEDTIEVTKDLVLKNKSGQQVVFQLPKDKSVDSDKLSAFKILQGTMVLEADNDSNLVFNGLLTSFMDLNELDPVNNVPKGENTRFEAGAFITVESGANLIGKSFTMQNLEARGMMTGSIYIKPNGKYTMDGGRITRNIWTHGDDIYRDWKPYRNDETKLAPNSAAVSNYGGTFIMNGGSIDHNYSAFGQGPAYSGGGAILNQKVARAYVEINGGNISNNTVGTHSSSAAPGGAFFIGLNQDLVINDGTFSNNLVKGFGGAIFSDWGTSLTINGGRFEQNRATEIGGAIVARDRFIVAADTPNLATNKLVDDLSENAYSVYAGYVNYDIEAWYARRLGAYTTINGGEFINNESGVGGAIYLSANAEVNAGLFKGNKAMRYGGAIYLATQPYALTVRNAYFTNNRALMNSPTAYMYSGGDLPPYYHKGSGGAIWYCPTGEGIFNVSNGAAIYNNLSENEGNDITKMNSSTSREYLMTVSNRMLGGGYVAWYNDLQGARANDASEERTDLNEVAGELMLRSKTSERAFTTARALATTIFEDNEALRGGAIGTNGIVNFGDSDQQFKLRVTAEFDPSVSNKKPLNAQVYVVDGEDKLLVDEAILNQDNNFEKLLTGLPLQARNAVLNYIVVLSNEDYEATYQASLNDAPLQDGHEFSTRELLNNDLAHVHIIVKEKPKSTTPIEIITPETPVKAEVIVPKTGITETISGYIVICLLLIGMIVLEIHHYKKS